MFFTYFDEVKYHPPVQTGYWFGGISVDVANIPILEEQMNELSRDIFGTQEPKTETEFHAKFINSGKGAFKGMEPEERYNLLKRLAHIVDQPELLKRVYFRLLPDNIVANNSPHDELAFMLFLEQVDLLYAQLGTKGLVIGDHDNDQSVSKSVKSMSWYRQHQTDFKMGRKIENILDTVHFAHSHHSRLLQIADCYLWFCQLMVQPMPKSHYKKDLMEYIRTNTNATFPDKCKVWPSTRAWYSSVGVIT